MKKELSIRHLVIVTMNLRLLQFLIKKKVLSAFLDNCEKRMFNRKVIILQACQKDKRSVCDWGVGNYFSWERSNEGHCYWQNLSTEFSHNKKY